MSALSPKMVLWGVTSLITLTVLISLLGVMHQLLKTVTSTLNLETNTNFNKYYCVRSSDCKKNPSDCSECVNVLFGGFTVLNKCGNEPLPCKCINNKCVKK